MSQESEVFEQEQGLRYRTEVDRETGLWNKNTTERMISTYLKEHWKENHAFLMFTIDNFENVAHQEGPLVEEQLLSVVARVLGDNFRHTDLVGRIGHGDFVALATNVPDERTVRRKIASLTEMIKRNQSYALPTRLSLSVGFTMSDGQIVDYVSLYGQAEEALNKVRALKRGRIFAYNNRYPELQNDYCGSNKTVLVVEDDLLNRRIVVDNLADEYHVLEAKNGKEALDILHHSIGQIDGIILDLVMPIMNGYEFLKIVQVDERYKSIPVIIATAHSEGDNETQALQLGVWDFVTKPFHMGILKQRLRNAVMHSQLAVFNQLQYLAEYDQLTGIYNKGKFFEMTRDLLFAYPNENFVFIRMDIENFKLVNSYFGSSEGDRLLRRIGEVCQEYAREHAKMTYGYIHADIFCFCVPFEDAEELNRKLEASNHVFDKISDNFKIIPKFGLYIIDDKQLNMDEIYDRAIVAARSAKRNYICTYAYYEKQMMDDLERESEIARDMQQALDEGQFIVYYQPKYATKTNYPNGAEALIRWQHPEKGMVSPAEFIPVFEKNGFITRLDYYVWEAVCKFLHNCKEMEIPLVPISVNVSRMNLYNPKIVSHIKGLVDKYEIPVEMLNLEITETAYTENPIVMHQAIAELRDLGFIIMMDDFGSGYSSLNMLKDLSMDVLKVDMKFLPDKMNARAERILASIVRMARWLDMQVVVEGVEKTEQVSFLQQIGADFIQGYFYAKPMPEEEYQELMRKKLPSPIEPRGKKDQPEGLEELWQAIPYASVVFDGLQQPVALYRYDGNEAELLRANTAFTREFGYDELTQHEMQNHVDKIQKYEILSTFEETLTYHEEGQCEYVRKDDDGKQVWMQMKLKYSGVIHGENIFVAIFTDITKEKNTEKELEQFQTVLRKKDSGYSYILIADDQALNRAILSDIFKDKYHILEAKNGEEALQQLKDHGEEIALVLLDIEMPVMTGIEFLQKRQELDLYINMPVIVVSGDDSSESKQESLELGVNDYITKPFVKELVLRRVHNVLDYSDRFAELMKEYQSLKKSEEK